MNIVLFKQDLDQYSNTQIKTMAKMYDLHGDINDLRWLVAIKNSQSSASMITGDTFIDMNIIEKLDDDTLLQYCNTSPKIRKQCDPIWLQRLSKIGYNGELAPAKDWQQIYVLLKKYKEFLINTKDFNIVYDNWQGYDDVDEAEFIKERKYMEIAKDSIKAGATNIFNWLMNTNKLNKHIIHEYFLLATKYCRIDILNNLDQNYWDYLNISAVKRFRRNYFEKPLEKACLDVLKFWYDRHVLEYSSVDADFAFKNGNSKILDFFVTMGVKPGYVSVKYAIDNDMLAGLKWLIDNGVRFTRSNKNQLAQKDYGKQVLDYLEKMI